MNYIKAVVLGGLAFALAGGQAQAQSAVFDFENTTLGTNDPDPAGGAPTPFVVSSSGGPAITATFATQQQGAGITAQFGINDNNLSSTAIAPISGKFVFGGETVTLNNKKSQLLITFSAPLSDISFNYVIGALDTAGINDIHGDKLLVEAALGVGAFSDISGGGATGADNTLGRDQGSFAYPGGMMFDKVRLTANLINANTFSDFGIDNVRGAVAVPEPGTVGMLLGSGLAGAMFLVRRRR